MGQKLSSSGSIASQGDYNALADSMSSDININIPSIESLTYDLLDNREYKGFFKKLRTYLERFTKEWNEDDSKRDKTYTVFNQLKDAKNDMQDNLQSMLERDGKIEESLVKGQQLYVQTTSFKKNASAVNRKMKWRYYCYWFWLCFIAILALTLLICWWSGAFSSSSSDDDKK